jgi:hypothetical protein
MLRLLGGTGLEADGPVARKLLRLGELPPKPALPAGRIPHLARLMAPAIKYDKMIQDGLVRDDEDLARLGGVTPARMTQIMGMLNLAPDIQELILFLPLIEKGRDPLCDRVVWAITREANLERQRGRWGRISFA